MKLVELLQNVARVEPASQLLPDMDLAGLCEHTQEVEPGFGFVAVAKDTQNLQQHCLAAQQSGASVLLVDAPQFDTTQFSVACVQVPGLADQRGVLAARFYDDPSLSLTCVGVTGTNGKTSVAFHLADLSTRLGAPMGYSGTLGWGCINNLRGGEMTTANAIALQRQMACMRQNGAQGVALEVSSHALAQNRADAVHFDYAVFTNLSRDHLDYHGSFEAYGAAKRKLFTQWPLQAAVINVDDAFGARLVHEVSCPVITYGNGGDWSWQREVRAGEPCVCWRTPSGEFTVNYHAVADYVVANLTATMAVLAAGGAPVEDLMAQVAHLRSVPGRLQALVRTSTQPSVVVDYAHTPDALEKVLQALRADGPGRLICIVGCGGDRDKGKRPQMAEVASRLADVVWFTADNPRGESPESIIDDMLAGVRVDGSGVHIEIDRAAAIRQAIISAQPHDMILIAGKGHEAYQEIDGQKLPFDDYKVAAGAMEELH